MRIKDILLYILGVLMPVVIFSLTLLKVHTLLESTQWIIIFNLFAYGTLSFIKSL